ncbi:MAG: hypothetical protein J6K98_03965, partial [Clostridia bacterium]|nr:hypothetical protein [Clostridia bacterium]
MNEMTFRHVFGEYIADPGLMARIGEGEVSGLQVDTSSRTVQLTLHFAHFVPVEEITQAEVLLCQALAVAHVHIHPRYPAEALTAEVFPSLVTSWRRRSVAVNGNLDGAACRIEDNQLVITLTHGGSEVLESTGAVRELEMLIREQFGRPVQVKFDGQTEVDTEGAH